MANPLTSLSERLFEHAQSCPRTVALTRLKPDGTVGDSFDYSQVEKRTSALAALLIERGEQGRPVLIPERNSCDYVIAYLLDFAGPLSIHGTSDGAAKKYD